MANIFDVNFWLASCFFIFIYLAYPKIHNIVKNFLQNKINSIENRINHLKNLQKESKDLLDKIKNEYKDLENSKEYLIKESKDIAEILFAEQSLKIEEVIKNKEKESLANLDSNYNKFILDLKKEINSETIELVKKYFLESKDIDDLAIAKSLINKK